MRIALAQLNPTVGDVAGNTALVLDAIARARDGGATLLICPELAIIGYPPRDLLLREGVVEACEQAVRNVASHARDITVVIGHPRRAPNGVRGVRNSASICRDGEILAVYDKRLLPGYDIFDEDRYFDPGDRQVVVDLDGERLGVLICEDLWRAGDVTADPTYAVDPLQELAGQGCTLIAALNASPFALGKNEHHQARVREAAARYRVPIAAVNQVGANDDLIFDGRSVLIGGDGQPRAILPGWEPALGIVDLDQPAPAAGDSPHTAPLEDNRQEDTFRALVLGVRDYCRKTKHERILLGLSGGIDSALTAVIAAVAIGPANVTGLLLPSRYSSPGSIGDARDLAERLGLTRCAEIGIESMHEAIRQALDANLRDGAEGLTDENIQARLRGLVLMAHSNATGALVLATGNKSELAMGYATLYGDMNGALAVLGDVLKTRVYELSRWINANHAVCGFAAPPIPGSSITKPPSAELRPDQTDQDTLPPYDVLDEIVARYVELEQSADRIATETGFDEALVRRTAAMIDRAEYKRQQAAVILKVSQRTFGRGRPMPIVMG